MPCFQRYWKSLFVTLEFTSLQSSFVLDFTACLNLCHQNSQSSRVLTFHPVFIIVTRCVTYLVLTKVSSSNDRALRSHTWVLGFKRKKYIYPSVLFLIVNATASLWNWVVRAIMQVVSRIHISRDMFSIMEMTIHVVKWRGYCIFCSECLSTAAFQKHGPSLSGLAHRGMKRVIFPLVMVVAQHLLKEQGEPCFSSVQQLCKCCCTQVV